MLCANVTVHMEPREGERVGGKTIPAKVAAFPQIQVERTLLVLALRCSE